jgi:hypothetical protein
MTEFERQLDREATRAGLPLAYRRLPIEAEHQLYPDDRGAIAAAFAVVALCGAVFGGVVGWILGSAFG